MSQFHWSVRHVGYFVVFLKALKWRWKIVYKFTLTGKNKFQYCLIQNSPWKHCLSDLRYELFQVKHLIKKNFEIQIQAIDLIFNSNHASKSCKHHPRKPQAKTYLFKRLFNNQLPFATVSREETILVQNFHYKVGGVLKELRDL